MPSVDLVIPAKIQRSARVRQLEALFDVPAQEQKQLEWTSGMERTSVIRLAPDTPHGTVIPMLIDNESWSYYYTPDVRYGKEDLYQAFQLHSHHLHRWELKVE